LEFCARLRFPFAAKPGTIRNSMKRTLLLLTLVFTAAASRADLVIEQKMESSMMNGDVTLKVKGDKMRMDMTAGPAGAMSTIMDMATGDSITLMHAQKMAMKVSGAQAKQMMDAMKQQREAAGAAAPKLEDTGKKEKVGEYNAEIYTWTGSGVKQTLWVSKEVPNYEKIKEQMLKLNDSPFGGVAKGMSPDMAKLPGLVVKTQMEMPQMPGQKITTTLVSVKEQPVDDSTFAPPSDYQQMNQPALPSLPAPAAK
jgi:hypothetical protein